MKDVNFCEVGMCYYVSIDILRFEDTLKTLKHMISPDDILTIDTS